MNTNSTTFSKIVYLLIVGFSFLVIGCVRDGLPSRLISSARVGGVVGDSKVPISSSKAEIKRVILGMQPILEQRGFKLDDTTPARARYRTSIGYGACYSYSRGDSSSLFQCQIDGDVERFDIQFIEYATGSIPGSDKYSLIRYFKMTPEDREFIYETAKLLRDYLQPKFPNRKIGVSFVTYE